MLAWVCLFRLMTAQRMVVAEIAPNTKGPKLYLIIERMKRPEELGREEAREEKENKGGHMSTTPKLGR